MKLLLFRVHQGDILSGAIKAVTRESWTHAAILLDESKNQICEAFFPHVRYRTLDNSELHGIDVFDISTTYPNFTPLSPDQVQGVLDYCAQAVAAHEGYSIKGLFDFVPGIDELIGKVADDGVTSKVFCSQFFDDALDRGANLKILNVSSDQLAPGYLTWSVLIFPALPLKLLPCPATAPASKPSFAVEFQKAVQQVTEAVRIVQAPQSPLQSPVATPGSILKPDSIPLGTT